MSFDRFLLAVESRDLSQADKILIRVSSFRVAFFGITAKFIIQKYPSLSFGKEDTFIRM